MYPRFLRYSKISNWNVKCKTAREKCVCYECLWVESDGINDDSTRDMLFDATKSPRVTQQIPLNEKKIINISQQFHILITITVKKLIFRLYTGEKNTHTHSKCVVYDEVSCGMECTAVDCFVSCLRFALIWSVDLFVWDLNSCCEMNLSSQTFSYIINQLNTHTHEQ